MLAASIVIFRELEGIWWVYIALLLVPDLSMLGYLMRTSIGAHIYNAAHTILLPIAAVIIGHVAAIPWLAAGGAIWLGHIGADRLFLYGLKYPSGFKDNHLKQV